MLKAIKQVLLCVSILFFNFPVSQAAQTNSSEYIPYCFSQPGLYESRSKELKEMYDADQKEREDLGSIFDMEAWKIIDEHDLERRKQVARIFAEGCFKTADDYDHAAMIYQHGKVPDHFYQAFVWARHSVELGGGSEQKHLVALAADRYLVNIGHKQLFGSQVACPNIGGVNCCCVQPIEESFPDSMRKEYGVSVEEVLNRAKISSTGKDCPSICPSLLKPTPKGTMPEIW